MKDAGVSVIVCCYNSEARIELTLNHLVLQDVLDSFSWEIIVIDNNSSDHTATIAKNFLSVQSSEIDWKIVFEQNPGLSSARNRGFEEAKYNIVLMVDDDNSLSSNYIQGVWNSFQVNPNLGMVGGLGIAELESEPPSWFKSYDYCYAIGPQSKNGKPIEHLYGAGLALRMDVLEKVRTAGFRSLLSDRIGNSLMSGGDTELCFAYRMAGYELMYDSELTFKHHLPADRVNWNYLCKLFYGFGRTKARLDIYSSIMAGNPIPERGRFPAWFNRVVYLSRNLSKDIFVLIGSAFVKLEGSAKLLSAKGKLGQIQGIIELRHEYEKLHAHVSLLQKNLTND